MNEEKKNDNNISNEKIRIKKYIFNAKHTVQDLANILEISNVFLIKKFIELGIKTNINQILKKEEIELLGSSLDIEVIFESKNNTIKEKKESKSAKKNQDLIQRVPIVTIMGHVDHGKTTLLDTIRKTRLVDKEFGGITQHIGAYEINYNNQKITFIDSPGHEAFFQMRSRGAQVTDICLLIVAADDGVKPQTIESVKHAQNAQVEIIVVINKIDKLNNKKESIMNELSALDLIPEEWGGRTPYIEISAFKKTGIDDLLKMILLVHEMKNIKTSLTANTQGVVLEASLDKNRGPSATLITLQGTLKIGDTIISGNNTYGKIRTIQDDLKNNLKKAYPSQPVLVTGLETVPEAGDAFEVVSDKKVAKQIIEQKQKNSKEQQLQNENKNTINDNILNSDLEKEPASLNVVIKADTQGSLEAIIESLNKLEIPQVKINILKASVGMINFNDIDFANNFDSLLISFNNPINNALEKAAKNNKVEIKNYNIIYKLIEDIEKKLTKLIEPVTKEVITGQAEIKKIFSISSIGNIAGCYVIKGTIYNNAFAKVIRNNETIYQGKIVSLKHLKNNINSAIKGHECGILLDNFNNFQINDIIESSRIEKVV
ncbi:translation initiation factor IF-2 ['Camptotheca acuminata' phytoplasma]|uniref:translation initiation factor IF-2 n=1 Tax='Camptotheca acuminata' phytoplasma TaxID=3239192 RepID=UPI00351A5D47